jgi:hypothetical protein
VGTSLGIEVFENVLSLDHFDRLSNVVTGSDISWYYYPMYHNLELQPNPDGSTHGFMHNFFDNDRVSSDYINLLDPILNRISEHFGCPIIPVRIKMNMTLNVGKQVAHYPHIDKPEAVGNNNFKTAIYYLNDSDGDTLFFNNTNTVVYKQSPKRNTLVVFNGETLHAPQLPLIATRRIVININVLLDR